MENWKIIALGSQAKNAALQPGKTYRLYFGGLSVQDHRPADMIYAVRSEFLLGRQVEVIRAAEHLYTADKKTWTMVVEIKVLSAGNGGALGKQSGVVLTAALVIAAITAMSLLLFNLKDTLIQVDELSTVGVKVGDKTYGLKLGGLLTTAAVVLVIFGMMRMKGAAQ